MTETKMTSEEVTARLQETLIMNHVETEAALKALKKESGFGMGALRAERKALAAGYKAAVKAEKTCDLIDFINKDWFVLTQGNKVRIARVDVVTYTTHISNEPSVSKRVQVTLLPRADFVALVAPLTPDDTGEDSAGNLWLRNHRRREYAGLCVEPGGPAVVDGKLNIWRGWGVEPNNTPVGPFLGYIRTIIANGDLRVADYLLDWMAMKVQQPKRTMGVVPVLFSETEGTGKSTLGYIMRRIFGLHGAALGTDTLLGNFNAGLIGMLFVQCDEINLKGRLAMQERYKSIVTTDTLSIEQKGVDVYQSENTLGIMATTNISGAVPQSKSDRRTFSVEVSKEAAGSRHKGFWNDFYGWLDGDGIGAILTYLKQRDVSGFHPAGDRPLTSLTLRNKRATLRQAHAWWAECVECRTIIGLGLQGGDFRLETEIPKEEIYRAYLNWQERQRIYERKLTGVEFWIALRQLGAIKEDGRTRKEGRNVTLHDFDTAAARMDEALTGS